MIETIVNLDFCFLLKKWTTKLYRDYIKKPISLYVLWKNQGLF